ncbi:MAG: hypothetical protein M3460_02665 [Actinomycetota bacterium]|nr:hypothetical protein [Actinomycetota bacterium]
MRSNLTSATSVALRERFAAMNAIVAASSEVTLAPRASTAMASDASFVCWLVLRRAIPAECGVDHMRASQGLLRCLTYRRSVGRAAPPGDAHA